jgi:hypothetical protein
MKTALNTGSCRTAVTGDFNSYRPAADGAAQQLACCGKCRVVLDGRAQRGEVAGLMSGRYQSQRLRPVDRWGRKASSLERHPSPAAAGEGPGLRAFLAPRRTDGSAVAVAQQFMVADAREQVPHSKGRGFVEQVGRPIRPFMDGVGYPHYCPAIMETGRLERNVLGFVRAT